MKKGVEDGSLRPMDHNLMTLVSPGINIWLAKDLIEVDAARQIEIGDQVAELGRIGLAAIAPAAKGAGRRKSRG
jgi:hypothetical protein